MSIVVDSSIGFMSATSLTSFEGNEVNGWCCSKCSSIAVLRFLLFITKNAITAPTTSNDMIIPAIPPPPIPDFPPELGVPSLL
uniref:Ltk2 n=1 Tax=Arundo donax TaxID=35708 RepID=A0A0A9FFF6_ARUDO